jgi:hypothetical protein
MIVDKNNKDGRKKLFVCLLLLVGATVGGAGVARDAVIFVVVVVAGRAVESLTGVHHRVENFVITVSESDVVVLCSICSPLHR